ADHLAAGGNQHNLVRLADGQCADHTSGLFVGFHRDNAFAAARLKPIDLLHRAVLQHHVERRAFADAVLSGYEQRGVFDHHGESDHGVVWFQRNPTDAGGGPPHGTDVIFRKTDAHALARDENDLIVAGGQFDLNQVIARVNANSDDSSLANIRELGHGGLF